MKTRTVCQVLFIGLVSFHCVFSYRCRCGQKTFSCGFAGRQRTGYGFDKVEIDLADVKGEFVPWYQVGRRAVFGVLGAGGVGPPGQFALRTPAGVFHVAEEFDLHIGECAGQARVGVGSRKSERA